MHGPALFRRQVVNRQIHAIPEMRIGFNVGLKRIFRRCSDGFTFRDVGIGIQGIAALFLAPCTLLCVEA